MNYATNIALVDRATGKVNNIIWGMVYQEEEFSTADTQAVVIEGLPVQIGDSYDREYFWHGEDKVLPIEDVLTSMDKAYAEGVNSI